MSLNVLIIEDELPARAKLEEMLVALRPDTNFLARLGSVKDSVDWLTRHQPPDVAFVDIQLSDDHSFEIFRRHPVQFPVIFTTAYDKYLLESFEYNAIDYLLKPIAEEKLKRSLDKLDIFERHFMQGNMLKLLQTENITPVKDRIVVRKGTDFITLEMNAIAYFYTEHKIVFVRDVTGRQFITDKNLGELEAQLDTRQFFRLNRKYIVNLKAIERFKPDQGKIRVYLQPEMTEEIHVSKETAPAFRRWMGAD